MVCAIPRGHPSPSSETAMLQTVVGGQTDMGKMREGLLREARLASTPDWRVSEGVFSRFPGG